MTSERGTALLTVMWVVLIISIVSMALAASVRMQVRSDLDSFDSNRAFFMAKGAAESMFALIATQPDLPKDSPIVRTANGDYVFPLQSGEVHVRFESAEGLIDLNQASDRLLAAMFDSVGVSEEERNHLVDSILDWRDADDIPHLYGAEINDYTQIPGHRLPRNAPFESVDELLQVKYMTPQIYNGALLLDSVTGQYRRMPGVRDLLTIDSHSDKIEVNEASVEVLNAMPQVTAAAAEHIFSERSKQVFDSMDDVLKRVPELKGSPALEFLTAGTSPAPTALISRATVQPSGVSRTVRIVLKREDRFQILTAQPLIYRIVKDVKFGHWQF
jgi:general secretion pathway protein K